MRKCSICGSFLVPCNEGIDHTCLPAGRSDSNLIHLSGWSSSARAACTRSKIRLNTAYLTNTPTFDPLTRFPQGGGSFFGRNLRLLINAIQCYPDNCANDHKENKGK